MGNRRACVRAHVLVVERSRCSKGMYVCVYVDAAMSFAALETVELSSSRFVSLLSRKASCGFRICSSPFKHTQLQTHTHTHTQVKGHGPAAVQSMQFIGSDYLGLTTRDGKRFDGLGLYTFPNGDRYVGGMLDGVFHGHGVLFFCNRSDAAAVTAAAQGVGEEEDDDDGQAALMGFLSGCGDQKPTPTGNPNATTAAAAETKRAGDAQQWCGQFRGVWDHGRNVSGSYLFFDGLVYTSETHPSGAAVRQQLQQQQQQRQQQEQVNSAGAVCAPATAAGTTMAWPYCECKDRRVWAEHLRNITPVLPYESPLGGTALQEALAAAADARQGKTGSNGLVGQRLWAEMPILVPSSPETDVAPSVFAHGQPKSGAELGPWEALLLRAQTQGPGDDAALAALAAVVAIPTAPLEEEQDPDVEMAADGTMHNRHRRVTNPNYQPRLLLARDRQTSGGTTVAGDGSKRALTPCVASGLAPTSAQFTAASAPHVRAAAQSSARPCEAKRSGNDPHAGLSTPLPPASPLGVEEAASSGETDKDSDECHSAASSAVAVVNVDRVTEIDQTEFSATIPSLRAVVASPSAGGEVVQGGMEEEDAMSARTSERSDVALDRSRSLNSSATAPVSVALRSVTEIAQCGEVSAMTSADAVAAEETTLEEDEHAELSDEES